METLRQNLSHASPSSVVCQCSLACGGITSVFKCSVVRSLFVPSYCLLFTVSDLPLERIFLIALTCVIYSRGGMLDPPKCSPESSLFVFLFRLCHFSLTSMDRNQCNSECCHFSQQILSKWSGMSADSASTGSPLYPQAPYPRVQPVTDGEHLRGESPLKFQKAVFESVHMQAAVYMAFTLCLQLFTQHLHCIRYYK